MTLMEGVRVVREGIADFFEVGFPAQRTVALEQWGATEAEIPLPDRYDAYEPTGISTSTMSLIGVSIARASNFRHVGFNNRMEEQYIVRYPVRLFCWAYTPDVPEEDRVDGNEVPPQAMEAALKARDNLAAVARTLLLSNKTLGHEAFAFIENSYSEEYSDATKTSSQSGRWIAGVALAFDLDVDESLYRDIHGTANTITVEGRTIPITQ